MKNFNFDKWLIGIFGSLFFCWPGCVLVAKGWGLVAVTRGAWLAAMAMDAGVLVMAAGFAVLLAAATVFCVCWSRSPNGTLYAMCMVLGALAWSALVIATRRVEEEPPGTQVIRLAHWQLEPLVREGFDKKMRDYERMRWERDRVRVKVIQVPIPEATYGQWLTCQLMGGTAPDLIELGLGLPNNVLAGYCNRYFQPFTREASLPNPYNARNEHSNTAWRLTYKDGMRQGYNETLQEYMQIPLSMFGMRVFYNKDLLEKLAGTREAPKDWQEFKALCKKIKAQRMPKKDGTPDPDGKFYTPIVGSISHYTPWETLMADPLSYGVVRMLDYSRDGWLDPTELYTAVREGRVTFDIRPFRAKFGILEELLEFFQPGFTGLYRDEGVMLFIQQGAVFMTAGTWDQGGIREQARGIFDLGLINFPQPAKDDPDYGDAVEGKVYENSWCGFPFHLTRTSRHPELAIDFMQYLSCKDVNQEFNELLGWIPAIRGTKTPDDVKVFEPNLKGTRGGPGFMLGGDTATKWNQLYSLFKVGKIKIWDMLDQYTAYYMEKGPDEFMEMVRNERRGIPGDERMVAIRRAQMINAQRAGAPPERVALEEAKYRRVMLRLTEKGFHYGLMMRIQNGMSPFEGNAYGMSSTAKEKVREKIRGE